MKDSMLLFEGVPEIKKAIHDFMLKGQDDPSEVLNAIINSALEEAEVLVPVNYPEGSEMSGNEDEIEVEFLQISAEEDPDLMWFPVFTDEAEFNRGEKVPCEPIAIARMIEIAASEVECGGIIFNPWGENFALTKEACEDINEITREHTQDEMDLLAGAEAYQDGDFQSAIMYYERAADAGNIKALSNLGYCYYYGRSIPVDKEMARMYWEKAALLGDVCATYKIGDMYRIGDLPYDEDFAKAMYRKAFEMSCEKQNVDEFPDVCLRILKYCKDDCDKETYERIARDAVDGFKTRIEAGDNYSGKLLAEAQAILDSIVGKKMMS